MWDKLYTFGVDKGFCYWRRMLSLYSLSEKTLSLQSIKPSKTKIIPGNKSSRLSEQNMRFSHSKEDELKKKKILWLDIWPSLQNCFSSNCIQNQPGEKKSPDNWRKLFGNYQYGWQFWQYGYSYIGHLVSNNKNFLYFPSNYWDGGRYKWSTKWKTKK